MNLLKAASRALDEVVTATELKGVTDPAIVQRLRKAQQLAGLLSKRKIQTFDRVRIAQICTLLRDVLDFVPLSVKQYRKQMAGVHSQFVQIIEMPEKTSRSGSASVFPRKTSENKAVYDDLIMQHCEIDEMARSVRSLSRTVGRQRQDIAIQQQRHEEELGAVENMFKQETFKERRKELALRQKELELRAQQSKIEEISGELQRLRQENAEEKLVSQLQLKQLASSLRNTQEVQNATYQSTFNIPAPRLSVDPQAAYNAAATCSQAPAQQQLAFAETDKEHYVERIAQALKQAAPRQDDSKRLRELKMQGIKVEIGAVIDEIAATFLQPADAENQALRTRLQQESQRSKQIEEEHERLVDQLQQQSMQLEKMRYENQRIREELQNLNKQLETSRIQSRYPDTAAIPCSSSASRMSQW